MIFKKQNIFNKKCFAFFLKKFVYIYNSSFIFKTILFMNKELIISAFVFILLTSCKKEINEPIAVPTVQEEMVADVSQIICYQGIIKKDTINLSLQVNHNQEVNGELAYVFFEKDRNKGTILGKMFGDTLKANYTFMSEGKESLKEIVFLRKGKIIIEGYGDVEEKEGKSVFVDLKKLYFDSATVLSEIDCSQVK